MYVIFEDPEAENGNDIVVSINLHLYQILRWMKPPLATGISLPSTNMIA